MGSEEWDDEKDSQFVVTKLVAFDKIVFDKIIDWHFFHNHIFS